MEGKGGDDWGFAPNPTRELSSLDLPSCFAACREAEGEVQKPQVSGRVWDGVPTYLFLFFPPYLPHQLLKRGQKLVDGFVLAFADVLRDAGLDVVSQQHL